MAEGGPQKIPLNFNRRTAAEMNEDSERMLEVSVAKNGSAFFI